MADFANPSFLRRVLRFDAATCVATGLGLIVFAGFVARMLEIPSALCLAAGAVLLAFGAAVGYVGGRRDLYRPAVWWIAALNGLWAVVSVVALLAGWLDPNILGAAFVVIQAVVVALIAELQFLGLRRAAPESAAAVESRHPRAP